MHCLLRVTLNNQFAYEHEAFCAIWNNLVSFQSNAPSELIYHAEKETQA